MCDAKSNRITFPVKLRAGLDRVLGAVAEVGPAISRSYDSVGLVAKNVQDFLAENGVHVSLGQAEEIYALYSEDKFASWMVGGATIEGAGLAVIELCESVQEGENHVGL